MEFPSRRSRKLVRPKWTIWGIIFKLMFLSIIGILAFVGVKTGNYMGLGALGVLLFFLGLGFNTANLRVLMPGLNSPQSLVKSFAILAYSCLGLMLLTLVSQLPSSDQASPFEQMLQKGYFRELAQRHALLPSILATPAEEIQEYAQLKYILPQQETPIPETPPAAPIHPAQQEQKQETEAPVVKLDAVKTNPVVTKVLSSQILQINDQQIVRLIGVQVPDALQADAIRYLNKTVLNQEVSLEVCSERSVDDYGRIRAVVTVNEENINRKLIELGYSKLVITTPCSINLETWSDAEKTAKKQKRGIWGKHP